MRVYALNVRRQNLGRNVRILFFVISVTRTAMRSIWSPTQLVPGLKCGRVKLTAPIYYTDLNQTRLYPHAVSTPLQRGVQLNIYPVACTSTLHFTAIYSLSWFPKKFHRCFRIFQWTFQLSFTHFLGLSARTEVFSHVLDGVFMFCD